MHMSRKSKQSKKKKMEKRRRMSHSVLDAMPKGRHDEVRRQKEGLPVPKERAHAGKKKV